MYFYLSFTNFYFSTSYPAYHIEKEDNIFLRFVSISYIATVHADYHRKYYKLLMNHKSKIAHLPLFLSAGKTQDNKYAVTWKMTVSLCIICTREIATTEA